MRNLYRFFIVVLTFFALVSSGNVQAQTTLTTGDIAFTGYNGDNPDGLSFLLLTDIEAGTEISFTDNGWFSAGGFRANEQTLTWQATSALTCGTEVTIIAGTPSTGSTSGLMPAFAAAGDQVFAYQGTPPADNTPAEQAKFLAALQMNGAWDANAIDSNTSARPPAFTDGVNSNFINPEVDNAVYNCATEVGTAADLRAAINVSTNWTVDNTNPVTLPAGCAFDVTDCTACPTYSGTAVSTTEVCDGGTLTITSTAAGCPAPTAQSLDGDTSGEPTYERLTGNCGGASGSFAPYVAIPFTVDATDNYSFLNTQTGFDGFVTLYDASFDPLNPATGCIESNDNSFLGGPNTSAIGEFAPVSLTAGDLYYLVVTGVSASDFGSFTTSVTAGSGNIVQHPISTVTLELTVDGTPQTPITLACGNISEDITLTWNEADGCLFDAQTIDYAINCDDDGSTLDSGSFNVDVYDQPTAGDQFDEPTGDCNTAIVDNCSPGDLEVFYSVDGGSTYTSPIEPDINPGDPDLDVYYQVKQAGAPTGCETTGVYTVSCPNAACDAGDYTTPTNNILCCGENVDVAYDDTNEDLGPDFVVGVALTPTAAVTDEAGVDAANGAGQVSGPFAAGSVPNPFNIANDCSLAPGEYFVTPFSALNSTLSFNDFDLAPLTGLFMPQGGNVLGATTSNTSVPVLPSNLPSVVLTIEVVPANSPSNFDIDIYINGLYQFRFGSVTGSTTFSTLPIQTDPNNIILQIDDFASDDDFTFNVIDIQALPPFPTPYYQGPAPCTSYGSAASVYILDDIDPGTPAVSPDCLGGTYTVAVMPSGGAPGIIPGAVYGVSNPNGLAQSGPVEAPAGTFTFTFNIGDDWDVEVINDDGTGNPIANQAADGCPQTLNDISPVCPICAVGDLMDPTANVVCCNETLDIDYDPTNENLDPQFRVGIAVTPAAPAADENDIDAANVAGQIYGPFAAGSVPDPFQFTNDCSLTPGVYYATPFSALNNSTSFNDFDLAPLTGLLMPENGSITGTTSANDPIPALPSNLPFVVLTIEAVPASGGPSTFDVDIYINSVYQFQFGTTTGSIQFSTLPIQIDPNNITLQIDDFASDDDFTFNVIDIQALPPFPTPYYQGSMACESYGTASEFYIVDDIDPGIPSVQCSATAGFYEVIVTPTGGAPGIVPSAVYAVTNPNGNATGAAVEGPAGTFTLTFPSGSDWDISVRAEDGTGNPIVNQAADGCPQTANGTSIDCITDCTVGDFTDPANNILCCGENVDVAYDATNENLDAGYAIAVALTPTAAVASPTDVDNANTNGDIIGGPFAAGAVTSPFNVSNVCPPTPGSYFLTPFAVLDGTLDFNELTNGEGTVVPPFSVMSFTATTAVNIPYIPSAPVPFDICIDVVFDVPPGPGDFADIIINGDTGNPTQVTADGTYCIGTTGDPNSVVVDVVNFTFATPGNVTATAVDIQNAIPPFPTPGDCESYGTDAELIFLDDIDLGTPTVQCSQTNAGEYEVIVTPTGGAPGVVTGAVYDVSDQTGNATGITESPTGTFTITYAYGDAWDIAVINDDGTGNPIANQAADGCPQTANGAAYSDTTDPVISACPANVGPQAMDAGQCGAVITWIDPTVSDDCAGGSIVRSDATDLNSGDLFPAGTTTIEYTATDEAGNTAVCSFNITINPDAENPTIPDCPTNIGPMAMDAGQCGATANWTEPTAADNCPNPTITKSDATGLTNGGLFPAGVTTIEYTAEDAVGNTALCSFTVTVDADAENPTIPDCPPNIGTLPMDAGQCGATANWTEPTINDNCPNPAIARSDATGLANGDVFPSGVTTVEYTATDAAGNTTACSFTVTVADDVENPVFPDCPANIGPLALDPTLCGAIATWGSYPFMQPTVTEFHYDNTGGDVGEFVELSGPAGTDLTGYTIYLYNDAGSTYDNFAAAGTIPDEGNGFGAVSVPTPGIQNGPADGFALVAPDGTTVLEVLSYEGTFTAINGPAAGMNSTDVGVSEPLSQPIGLSLQLIGGAWMAPAAHTEGLLNEPPSVIATDNCPGVTVMQTDASSFTNGDVFPEGSTTTIEYTATDAAGNTALCTFTVEVDGDNTPPVIEGCPTADIGPIPTDAGMCTAVVTFGTYPFTQASISEVHYDNDGTDTGEGVEISAPAGTDLTGYTVLMYNGADGNTYGTINLSGTIPDEGDGFGALWFAQAGIQNATPDPDGLALIAPDGVTVLEFISYEGVLTAANGAAAGMTSTDMGVSEPDNTPTGESLQIVGGVWTGPLAATPGTLNEPPYLFATDNCSGATLTQTDVSGFANGDTFPVGTSTLEFTATDVAGNTALCTFDVIVEDNENPAIPDCPNNIGPLDMDAGQCGATANWTEPTATDNCPGAGIARSDATGLNGGDLFPEGVTTIEYTATDAAGNTALCSFTVTVNGDMENPAIPDCPADIGALDMDAGQCGATANWTEPTATDNCPGAGIARSDVTGLNGGDLFPEGVTTIEYTATDAIGNTALCSFTVTVNGDAENPVIPDCPTDIGPLTMDAGTCTADATWTEPTTTDNCPGATIAQSDASGLSSGDAFPSGVTTIEYTATDAAGNTALCSFTVTVNGDMENPAIPDCPADIGALDMDAGQCGATANWTEPTATDNCPGAGIARSDATGLNGGDLFPEGVTTIEYTATDAIGNTALCSFTVTVNGDAENPVIPDCPNNIGPLDMDAGQCGATANWTEPTATDNCPGAGIARSDVTGLNGGDLFPEGVTTIEYTATDAAGNTALCSFTVTVNGDMENPAIPDCPNNIGPLDMDAGQCGATANWTEPTATDNCPGAGIARSDATGLNSGDLFSEGVTTIEYTATDAIGNTALCSFTVTVNGDAEPPTISNCPSDISGCSTMPTWTPPTASDNCPGIVTLTPSANPGDTFPIGTTTVTYTATDAAGNTAECSFDVTVSQLTVTFNSSDYNGFNVSCFGGNDGETTAMVTDGVAPYDYMWSNGGTTATITGLTAGTYTVTVMDAASCSAIESITLTEPTQLSPTAMVTSDYNGEQISCNGAADGEATASATGGVAPYGYAWSDGQTTAIATGLAAGSYDITVTDGNGCEATTSITLTEPAAVTINTLAQTADVTCDAGNDGEASVTASGGTGALSYAWSDGQTTATATGLSAGNYSVSVSDANGCIATGNVTIAPPLPPDFTVAVDTDFNGFGVSCNGATDGEASVTVNDGGTYAFAWSNGATTQAITGLGVGTYTVTVSGVGACSGTASVVVTEPAAVTCSISGSGPACAGDMDGELTATASGGVGGFTYDWDGPGGPYSGQTITGLDAGAYTLTVTDGNGCTCNTSFTIDNPEPLNSPQLLGGVNEYEGGASGGPYYYNTHQIKIGGGTQPYVFDWDNMGYVRFSIVDDPSSDSTIVNIIYADGASWELTVTDANGCNSGPDGELIFDNNVNDENAILDIESYDITADSGNNSGAIDITPTGGDESCGFYEYDWTSTIDPTFSETTEDISGLASGWYIVVVTDCSGDTTLGTYWVPQSSGGSTGGGFTRNKVAFNDMMGMSVAPNPANTQTSISFKYV